jgi:hypothetical protein
LFDINQRLETLATMLFHHMGQECVARKNFQEIVTFEKFGFTSVKLAPESAAVAANTINYRLCRPGGPLSTKHP